MNRDRAKGAYEAYRNNLINAYHVSEEEIGDFDRFMSIMRGDIVAPVYCDMGLETQERKRIYEQLIRGFKEGKHV